MSDDRPREWLRVLRPDEVTRKRLRRTILIEARPLLGVRRESWLDALADWATILSPVAAAVTLVFAGLALHQARPTRIAAEAAPPALEELVEPGRGLPAAFERDSVPDLDVVMTVIYEPDDSR